MRTVPAIRSALYACSIPPQKGKQVADFALHAPKSTINLSHLEEGLYFATYIVDGQTVKTQKVVVQR